MATTASAAGQTLVATQLMNPADYGLFVVAFLVLQFLRAVAEFGLHEAIIQRPTTPAERSGLWVFSLMSGLVAYGLFAVVAWPLAALNDDPRLVPLLLLLGLVCPFHAIAQVHAAVLEREMRFDQVGRAEVAGAIVGFTAMLAAAVAGFGAMALVIGAVATALVRSAGILIVAGRDWWPAMVMPSAALAPQLRFGAYQLGTRLTNTAVNRLDQIIISAFFGTEIVGIYGFAWMLIIDPIMRINGVVGRVALPAFARLRHAPRRLAGGFMTLETILTLLTAPLIIGGAVVAPVFFTIFMPAAWQPAVPILQILAVASLIRAINNPVGLLALATGRARLMFVWTLSALSVQVVVFTTAASSLSFLQFVVAVAVFNGAVMLASYGVLVRTVIGPSAGRWIMAVAPNLAVAAVMGAVLLAVQAAIAIDDIGRFVALVLLGIVVYASTLIAFRRDTLALARRFLLARRPG
ncbi:MAG: oligosaccharide flippase family protein [Alphaproteobacteria bacterium]|nr:oligosaccharide flippase family protein [Alphaproteobacteria bacterium]